MKILFSIGTRPELIKLAPVISAARGTHGDQVRVLLTGQHSEILDPLLRHFDIEPDIRLPSVEAPTLEALLAHGVSKVEEILRREAPDWLVVQGDTSSAFFSALAGFHSGTPVAHVEAGLRTNDPRRPFPEEMYRRLIAQIAAFHFAPTLHARDNLLLEGVDPATVAVTGNTSIDALHEAIERLGPARPPSPDTPKLLLATLHRRENAGAPLENACRALIALSMRGDVEILFVRHPNPLFDMAERLLSGSPRITVSAPLSYPDMVAALRRCHVVLTDSGGLQEEAAALGRPILVLRDVTERVEGVAAGRAVLAGVREDQIREAAERVLDDPEIYAAMARPCDCYGRGMAAPRIASLLSRLRPSTVRR